MVFGYGRAQTDYYRLDHHVRPAYEFYHFIGYLHPLILHHLPLVLRRLRAATPTQRGAHIVVFHHSVVVRHTLSSSATRYRRPPRAFYNRNSGVRGSLSRSLSFLPRVHVQMSIQLVDARERLPAPRMRARERAEAGMSALLADFVSTSSIRRVLAHKLSQHPKNPRNSHALTNSSSPRTPSRKRRT